MANIQFDRNLITWFIAVKGVGPKQLSLIIQRCKKHELSLREVYQNPQLLTKINIAKRIEESIKKFKKEYTLSKWLSWLDQQQINCLFKSDNIYPPLLKKIHYPPPVLFYRGSIKPQFWQWPISLVGSRNMTAYGKSVCAQLIKDLIELGVTTVSGGMYGVDLTVHQQTLKYRGKTAVILGHGFMHSYPSWIVKHHQQLLDKGAVIISQFSPFAHPSKGSFVARNQVVAGISPKLVVIEAAEKSGTHVTAQFALDENREVCAVPGPINSPYTRGTIWLINQGARLVTSGVDILYGDLPVSGLKNKSFVGENNEVKKSEFSLKKTNHLQRKIMQLLASQPLNFDQLLTALSLDSSSLMIELTQLELGGRIIKFGQHYRIN